MVGDWMHYSLLNNTCLDFSCDMFDSFLSYFPNVELYYDLTEPPPHDPWPALGWHGAEP
jgi:hypothetical protein